MATAAAQEHRNYLDDDFGDVATWWQEKPDFAAVDGYIKDTSTVYGTSVISRAIGGYIPENGNTTWQISVVCGYDNSSVNNFQFYLVANGSDPTDEDFCGVAVGTGFKPNYKALSLIFRHDGITEVLGTTEITFKKNKVASIEIERSAAGAWSIDGEAIYVPEMPSSAVAEYIVTSFKFNKTGAGKFAFKFDVFEQDYNSLDISASIDDATIIDPETIKIDVSGRLDADAASNPSNYSVCGVNPESVDYNFYDIVLHYPGKIPNKGEITLVAEGLRDGGGEPVDTFRKVFRQALAGQIIINEIMVDVNPAPYSLPAKKYVELYNTTSYDFDLGGYVFRVGDKDYEMDNATISADGYLILASDMTSFDAYGQCVAAFQESKLTIGGKHIALCNLLGAVVDSLTYSTALYNDKSRNSGGFSMERLDPYNNCTGNANWHVSNDVSGGTPGRKNSVYKVYVDDDTPALIGCELLTNSKLRLEFTERVSSVDFFVNGNYPSDCEVDGRSVVLTMPKPLQSGLNTIEGRAMDVCGAESDVLTAEVSYTPLTVEDVYAVSSHQVVINFSTTVSVAEKDFFALGNGAVPSFCEPVKNGNNGIMLTFDGDFESDAVQRLSIQGVESAVHDRIEDVVEFCYHRVVEGDILINEVMYYPAVGKKRYVELFNNSETDIFLFGLVLGGYDSDGHLIGSCSIDGYSMLRAGGFAVVAADTASVAADYDAKGLLVLASRFPTLNTSKGSVSLRSADGAAVDSMFYDNAMHSDLVANKRGVSLERISYAAPSSEPKNWTSASVQFGYATPGFENSCASDSIPSDNPNPDNPDPDDPNPGDPNPDNPNPDNPNPDDQNHINPNPDNHQHIDPQPVRQALNGEIIINEIMADVNPAPYSLPAKKYVELYNTSSFDFDLEGYVFRVGDKDYEMHDAKINAGDYLILASDTAAFARYGRCVVAFQESKITVGGKLLALINKDGAVVDSLTYSVDFYNEKDRSSGGFSMERLDPYNNCTGALNWHVANDLTGGTPGKINSVYKIYTDDSAPSLIGCELLTNSKLRLDFTETISSLDFTVGGAKPSEIAIEGSSAVLSMPSPLASGVNAVSGRAVDACGTESEYLTVDAHYVPLRVESVNAASSYQVLVKFSTAVGVVENEFFVLGNGAMPSSSDPVNDDGTAVLLTFADDFVSDAVQRLTIRGVESNVHDKIDGQELEFRYHRLTGGDIIINEVLYYPEVKKKRYVELYNNSGSDIFLFGLVLSGYTSGGDLLRSCIVDGYVMLQDGGFVVVAADTASVANDYDAKGILVEASRFPSLNTSKGYVSLRSSDGVLLDSMYYDNAMQSSLLDSKRGVALERISVDAPSLDHDNWASASEQFGFATPGFENSCAVGSSLDNYEQKPDYQDIEPKNADNAVDVKNRLLRPGDSDKELTLTFNFNRKTDPLLSVTIFDDHGREVRCLATEMMAYPGSTVAWDGRDRHGSRCKSGIYVVLIKAIDESGWSFVRKEACVIGNF